MIAAIVAPVDVRSIAMMRACLVSSLAAGLDDTGADRLRDTGLAVFRDVKRAAAFGLDLGLVMGSSEVRAAPSAAPPQPRLGKSPGRAGPRSVRALAASSHRSNAPIKPKSQSILSKIVALTLLKLTSDISRKLDRFPPKGYPLKVIALALSEKEDCGWNTSSEDRTELSQRCPSNFRIGLVAAPGAAGSMRVERQPLQLESALPMLARCPCQLVGGV
jgi:hypothetical protein